MNRHWYIAIFALGSMFASDAAEACTVIRTREYYPAERTHDARKLIEKATAIVDGEVIRALDGRKPAMVYAHHILKGPNHRQWFQVGTRDSCDVALLDAGQRLRLILVGGPNVYFLPVDYSNAEYEDAILRSDRRRVWPYRQGIR